MPCAVGGTGLEGGRCAALAANGSGATRGTGVSTERQWLGVHRQDRAAVVEGKPDQDDLHRARQPVTERVCGELSWAVPGRMLEPGATVDIDGSAGGGGRLPGEIQSGEAAQPAGLRESGGFCCAELSIPRSGRASPTLRRGWTRNKQKHKLNHVSGLTHGLAQKSGPGHRLRLRLCARSVVNDANAVRQTYGSISARLTARPASLAIM
jgi:hypothetical protein